MTKERLEEILQNVIEWGMDHDNEFMECLVYAMDLNEEEVKELELEEYTGLMDEFDEEDEGDGENDFDGCCPYCHSGNTDFVDSDEDSTKYICRDCNEDFIVHNDGRITTRNGFPINNESEEE